MILQNFLNAVAPSRFGRRPNRLAWLILPLLFAPAATAQDPGQNPRNHSGPAQQVVESPIKVASIVYRSGNRRDPFLNPLLFKKSAKLDEEIARGLPPPGIAGTYVAQASLEGISIRSDRRLAVMRGADARAYFLKEGDRLFDGYVKSIQLDSVTLVRETNMSSGKTLTQEVTKRLRTP